MANRPTHKIDVHAVQDMSTNVLSVFPPTSHHPSQARMKNPDHQGRGVGLSRMGLMRTEDSGGGVSRQFGMTEGAGLPQGRGACA